MHFDTGDDLNYNFIYRSLELIKDSDIVICFYLANEGISILENSAEFIPIPQKLKNILLQLRKKGDE